MVLKLEELIEMQKALMDRIDYNKKDRFDKTILALLVEVGECANEHRGFKYWSKDQESRRSEYVLRKEYQHLHVTQTSMWEYQLRDGFGKIIFDDVTDYHHDHKNPLLEEYVDGLHFVLQVGIELGYEHVKPYSLIQIDILEVFRIVYKAIVDVSIHRDKGSYELLLSEYISLGYHLGFTDDEIFNAYLNKNKTNHERQNNGY